LWGGGGSIHIEDTFNVYVALLRPGKGRVKDEREKDHRDLKEGGKSLHKTVRNENEDAEGLI